MLAEHFGAHMPTELRLLDTLREAQIVWPRVMTREEYDDPARPGTLAFESIVRAMETGMSDFAAGFSVEIAGAEDDGRVRLRGIISGETALLSEGRS